MKPQGELQLVQFNDTSLCHYGQIDSFVSYNWDVLSRQKREKKEETQGKSTLSLPNKSDSGRHLGFVMAWLVVKIVLT